MNDKKYIRGYYDGRIESINKVYEWLMDKNREPAQAKFTAGVIRNLAKEIEFRINEKSSKNRR